MKGIRQVLTEDIVLVELTQAEAGDVLEQIPYLGHRLWSFFGFVDLRGNDYLHERIDGRPKLVGGRTPAHALRDREHATRRLLARGADLGIARLTHDEQTLLRQLARSHSTAETFASLANSPSDAAFARTLYASEAAS